MKPLDVFYIHPSKSLNKIAYCIFPLGIISILNYLKEKDISIFGLNYPMEKCLTKSFNLVKFLKGKRPHVFVVDLHWHQHSYGALQIARVIKRIYPDIPVVFGGYTASFFAKEILQNFKEVDFVIKGDGNEPLFQLIKSIKLDKNYEDIPNLVYRKNEKVVETQKNFTLCNLDDLNFVDISFLHNYKYYYHTHLHYFGEKISFFVLCIASGCAWDCISCGGSKYSTEKILKRNFLKRSADRIFEDMKYLAKCGIKKIWLSHDLQCIGEEEYKKLFYKLRKENIKLGLVMDIWQTMSSDFLRDFSQTFEKKYSTFTISPMSGDENIRMKFGKLYDNKELINLALKIKNENIPFEIYFSYYLPDEDGKFNKTLEMINRIKKINLDKLFLECKPAIVDPASFLFDSPQRYNVKIVKKNFMDFYKTSPQPEFFYKISKKMIGYELQNSNTHPLFLYILWFFEKIKILWNRLFWRVKNALYM